MINNNNSPRESDFPLKQEGTDHEKAKASSSSTTSASQWLRLKDPRIVRVSRAFGGKDRHSKVCTIRGLRDRRVRLSVQTAIQLYDLQDRLGLNQPSKVVDWLLNAAKHEIDELPPLPNIIPIPGNNNFTLHANFPSNPMITPNNELEASTAHNHEPNEQNFNDYINRGNSEEMVTEEEGKEGISGNKEVTINHHHIPSFLGLLNTMPIGSYQQWEHHNNNVFNHVVPNFPSTLSLSTLPFQSTQSYFPSHDHHVTTTTSMDININSHYHRQMLTSSNSFTPSSFKIFHPPPNSSRESPSSHNKYLDFTSK